MLLRTSDEAPGDYFLQVGPGGTLTHSVLRLDHDDIRSRVDKILLVGGATRMPIVRSRLTSLWGEDKLVSETVAKPVEAGAIGGAWQQEEVSTVVDRLPFSVELRRIGGGEELYRAFQPTVFYRTLGMNPHIEQFRSHRLRLPADANDVVFVLRNADGHVLAKHAAPDALPDGCWLEIDVFGRCVLKGQSGIVMQLQNPYQHPQQVQLWERNERERQRREAAERERANEQLYRNVFLEND
jgi:hypothetical protein